MNTGDSTTQRILNPKRTEVKPVKNNNPANNRDASVTETKMEKARLAKEQRALKRIAGGTRKRKRDWEEDPAVSFSHAYSFNILTGWWMRILRTREACIYLGIRPAQFRQLIERGEIPTVNDPGTPTRVDINDLDKWIQRSKRTRLTQKWCLRCERGKQTL